MAVGKQVWNDFGSEVDTQDAVDQRCFFRDFGRGRLRKARVWSPLSYRYQMLP